MVTVDPTQLLNDLNAYLTANGPQATILTVNNLIAFLTGHPENAVAIQTMQAFLVTV